MDHELILKYLSTLGFPICVAIAAGYALWKLGTILMNTHMQFVHDIKATAIANTVLATEIKDNGKLVLAELQAQTQKIQKQTEILESPSTLFADVCKAEEKRRRPHP